MKSPQLLIVDDDYETQSYLIELLTSNGFQVDTANDHHQAMQFVGKTPYAAVLLSDELPSGCVFDTFSKIQNARPATGGLLLTSLHSYDKLKTAIDAGMWDVLIKPLNDFRLIERLGEGVTDYPSH